jgi:hypothetical protein
MKKGARMLLIRFNVWFGPSRIRIHETNLGQQTRMEPEIKQEAYATRLSLPQALRRMQAYEEAFNRRYENHSAVNYTLLGVDTIEDLSREELDIARVHLVEDQPTTAEQF